MTQLLKIPQPKTSGHFLYVLEALKYELKDARYFQILYQFSFLLYGLLYLGWDVDALKFTLTFATTISVQLIGAKFTGSSFSSVKSAFITSLALCLLLKTNHYTTAILAAALAIGSKFIIRYKGKHFFNPANFGIIITILLTGDAWISPGQWGQQAVLIYFLGAAGFMVLFKVGRIDTGLSFLAAFAALEYFRTVVYMGWEVEVLQHKLLNGSLLLFAFFMITDPVTTPNAKKARIIWAAMVGCAAFYFSNFMFVHTPPVWALFFISPLTVFFDKIYKAQTFKWLPS